jgi:serine/threonine protein phosphatase PrpC
MVYEETWEEEGWRIGGVIPEYYGQNWGSTLGGTLQITRSLKDNVIKDSLGISAEPSVAVYELNEGEECTLMVASDGFTDVFYFNEIVSGCESILQDNDSQITGSSVASAMLDQCMAKAKRYPNMFPVYPKVKRNDQGAYVSVDTAGWDDVSVAVCRLRN